MYNNDRYKAVLLSLLDRFVQVCTDNGLRYYLAAGTVLGAVRHKGFIPWDDDIDVYMPRRDYDALQRLPDGVFGKGVRLASWRNTKNYRYNFLKLESLDTTLLERFHPFYVGGLFLDIFPIDCYPSSGVDIEDIEKRISSLYNKMIESSLKNDNECDTLFELIVLKIKRLFYNHRKTVDRIETLATSFGGHGDMITDFQDYFNCHGGWPTCFFGNGVKMEFEGKYYFVPEKYDAYLSHLYGDYMTPPPLEKRYVHHFEFVDCERRVSTSELKREFRRIKRKYSYHFSLKKEIKRVFLLFSRW